DDGRPLRRKIARMRADRCIDLRRIGLTAIGATLYVPAEVNVDRDATVDVPPANDVLDVAVSQGDPTSGHQEHPRLGLVGGRQAVSRLPWHAGVARDHALEGVALVEVARGHARENALNRAGELFLLGGDLPASGLGRGALEPAHAGGELFHLAE